jgi:hypothetical protein
MTRHGSSDRRIAPWEGRGQTLALHPLFTYDPQVSQFQPSVLPMELEPASGVSHPNKLSPSEMSLHLVLRDLGLLRAGRVKGRPKTEQVTC